MLSPGTLLRALRAPSLSAAAMPVLCATALVAYDGHTVHGLYFALTLIGMVAAQGAVNLVNDYFDDASGLDADPELAKNPFPLESRVIQSGALSKSRVAVFAALCAGLALACGVLLNVAQAGNTVLWIALATGACWLVASFVGLLAMAILYMHHFPQHDADKRHGKRTPIVRLGPAGAGRLVLAILALPYLLLAFAIATGALPGWAALSFLSLPFALLASRIALASPADPKRLTAAFASVFGLHFTGGILLAGELLLAQRA